LNTIWNSEELCKGAINQLEKARAHLREVEMIAGEIRVNGVSQIEREKEDLINVASENLEQLEDPKNEMVYSEQQREIDQIRQQVSRQDL
jgi:hypothetical protein